MVGILATSPARVPRDTSAAPAAAGAQPAWSMSAHAPYTLLEQLLCLHALLAAGPDTADFAAVSAALQANEWVRASPDFDAERLSSPNLEQLYLRLLKDELRSKRHDATSPAKGAEAQRRKRKLSTPPLQSLEDAAHHTYLLPHLVDRLYASYQEHMVHAIREDEKQYYRLVKDVAEIERGEWDARLRGAATNGPSTEPCETTRDQDGDVVMKADGALPGPRETSEQATGMQSSPPRHPPSQEQQTAPQARSPVPSAGPPATVAYASASSTSHRASPSAPGGTSAAASPQRDSSSPRQQRRPLGSDLALPQTGAVATPPPGQTPQRTPHPPSDPRAASYGPPGQYQYPGNQPYHAYAAYGPQATMPTYPTPGSAQAPIPYPLAAQAAYQATRPGQGPPYGGFSSPHPGYMVFQSPMTGFSTPQQAAIQTPGGNTSRRPNLPVINTSVSSTKWKSTGPVQKSPTAPPRSPFLPSSPELSPIDGPARTPVPPSRRTDDARDAGTPTRGAGRRGRWAGTTTRGRSGRADVSRPGKETRTRSHSIGSHPDDSTAEALLTRRLRGDPATPNAGTEDTSAISTPASTSRPGHRRNAFRGSVDIGRPALKRKRANTLEGHTEVPSLPRQPTRPNHVLATRNFHRIVQPLMQEINSHKLASIFAKPITERDAPGYQSIIYQPQDLKSVRAAISAGSRAIQAAEKESNEAGTEDVASPAAPGSSGGSKAASIWLDKSPDVMPPKAIVNSSQLEKEIYRMFANAVMFNLDPHRGLGAAERRPKGEDEVEDSEDEDAEKHYEVDDGGAFVRDAREMFASVDDSVTRWRSVEAGGSRARGADESEADEATAEQ